MRIKMYLSSSSYSSRWILECL